MNQNVSSTPFLQVVGVHKRFTGVHALRGVSLSFERGQIYHLLGENGCGKSTLIKIISGAQPPSQGRIVIDGQPYDSLSPLLIGLAFLFGLELGRWSASRREVGEGQPDLPRSSIEDAAGRVF